MGTPYDLRPNALKMLNGMLNRIRKITHANMFDIKTQISRAVELTLEEISMSAIEWDDSSKYFARLLELKKNMEKYVEEMLGCNHCGHIMVALHNWCATQVYKGNYFGVPEDVGAP